jgi:hypothetical protein
MVLVFTQPLTEMSIKNLPGSKGRPSRKNADNLTAISEPIVYKMWELQHLTTLWSSTACYTDCFVFTFFFTYLTNMFNDLSYQLNLCLQTFVENVLMMIARNNCV